MISAGEFWLADIPFTDQSASKKRPVLILWIDAQDVVVAAVTSAATRSPTDVPLSDWKASGLRTGSTVRLSRLDCLEQSLLLRRLGAISVGDAQRIKDAWTQFVGPQVLRFVVPRNYHASSICPTICSARRWMASWWAVASDWPPSGTKLAVWLIFNRSGCTGMSL